MAQQPKTTEEIQSILNNIAFTLLPAEDSWEFFLGGVEPKNYYLQIQFWATDVETGQRNFQHCRKWIISRFMTETEIVETAWKAVEAAILHEARENFTYHNQRVFSPHFDVKERIRLCVERKFEVRQ